MLKKKNLLHLFFFLFINNIVIAQKDGNKSLDSLFQIRKILIEQDKNNSADFATNESLIGYFYYKKNDFQNSEKFYLNSITTYKTINDTENENYTATLQNLASIYSKTSNYVKSIDLLQESAGILNKLEGRRNIGYGYIIINLADNYTISENFNSADSLYKESINIFKEIVGENHPDYYMALNHYASFFESIQNYQKADSIYRIMFSGIKLNYGEENEDFISTLKGLGRIYKNIGNYYESEKFIKQALLIGQKLYTDTSYQYAQILFNLGRLYSFEKKYFLADSILNKVLNIYIKTFGEKSPNYAIVLSNIADLYIIFGDFKKAIIYKNSALSIFKQFNLNRYIALTLSSIGYTYFQSGDLKNAQNNLIEACEIQEKLFGGNSIEYSTTLLFLSMVYDKLGNYEEAIKSAIYVSQIREKLLGKNNSNYAGALNFISIIYFHLSNYENAISNAERAIKILQNIMGNDNPELISPITNLSLYYIFNNDYDKGMKTILLSNNLSMNDFKNQFFNLTNSEKLKYTYTVKNRIENIESIFYHLYLKGQPIGGLYYNHQLMYKSITLRSIQEMEVLIKKHGDSTLVNNFIKLKELKKIITSSYLNPILNQTEYLNKIKTEADELEKKITNSSTIITNNLKNTFNSNWKELQKKLKNTEVAIEFTQCNLRNKINTDSIFYGALVLKPGYKEPKFIYLFEQKQLESIIKKHSINSDSTYLNQLYQYVDNGNKMQELIWKPIDSLLVGVKTIYASPTGLLHTINLSALPLNNSTRIGEKYKLRILGSTGEILSHKEQYLTDSSINKAWIFGGVDYDNISFTQPKFSTDNEFNYSLPTNANTRSGTEKWNYLLNTLYEASSIDTLCRNNNITTSFINGKLASKTVLKNISGETKPYILHLATHGYFFPDIKKEREDYSSTPFYNKQNIFKISDNPLLRSGLIFSGANKAWSNPNYQSDSTDDGILTALEVSNLDLSEAKLVVMSACETGLGDIKGSEGVFGLQRAFKLAGAKNIIMSLWKVPDAQTKELMKLFYENCFNGLSVSDALRAAQKEMSKKYPPYYWAAFKLLE